MNLLLDTHVAIWWLDDPTRIPTQARVAIAEPANNVLVSAATAWEMSIKHAQGKLRTPDNLQEELANDRIGALAITLEHAVAAGALPRHHGDPFDRLLIAQARAEDLTIVTIDRAFEPYDVEVLNLRAAR
ncbi:MAG: type II toxin-antitoxin system VapC family toxin [Acidimicrobiia bacterium]